jgi:glycosyltransferase involved in cell wall biosynthesis
MRIAVIGAKGLPAKQGGIEHYCQEMYPRMVERNHSVDLFARSSYLGSSWLEQYEYKGVRVISLPCLQLRGADAFFSSLLGAIAASSSQYDIIHFHALGPSVFSWLPKLASTAKVVVTCQGLDWQRAKWGKISSRILYAGEQAAAKYADGIVVVSNELRSYFKQTYNRDTVYIPNGPARYAKTDGGFAYGTSLGLTRGKYITYVGRLVPEKRPDLLIEAFQKLNSPDWKLVLVGGTSDTDAFATQLFNLAANNPNIIFTGELRGEKLAEIVRGAGCFTLPSDLEGLPLAMLEAMQEGIPIVASDIPAHQQLIGQERGLLFGAGDVAACARTLERAIAIPKVLAQMAIEAQKYVQLHHNWDDITTETLNVYKTLCKATKLFPSVSQQLAATSVQASEKISR